MNKYLILFTASFFLLSTQLFSQVDYENIQVKSSFSGSWSTQKAKLVSLIQGYQAVTDGDDDMTTLGSYKHLRTDSTGFYYVKKINNRWWLIDPNGYAGINMAATSYPSTNVQTYYDITKALGFNGTGSFLSNENQTRDSYNLQNFNTFSYTRRLNFFLGYKNVRKNYYTTPTDVQGSLSYILVYDPQFEIYCNNLASTTVTPYKNERHLLGYFTDNEINFNQDQLQFLVRDLPAGDPSRDSALVFAAKKGLTATDCINYTSKVTEDIKKEFATLLAERYYRIVSAAIRKYDTNHLTLGSRLHGRPRGISGVVNASHKYMDVTSVNFYDKYSPNEQIAASTWTNNHPCLIGEFYIKDINAYSVEQPGAGWYVNSQSNRGKFYQNTTLELLKNKCYIGWHYFRFIDDADSNKGIVSESGVEYTDMTSYMKELNQQVYRICDFYDGANRRPTRPLKTETVQASEDTHVVPVSSNSINYGNSQEMEVRNHTTESNRREAYLKFDLSAFKSWMPGLKDARLELSCTTPELVYRYLYVSGIADNSWSESTLTGVTRNGNADWRNSYNRLTFNKGEIASGKIVFDVTQWIADTSNKEFISFKLFDLQSTTSSLLIASSESSVRENRPVLQLTFYDQDTATQNAESGIETKQLIYPNPASKFVYVKNIELDEFELFGTNGQKLLQSKQQQTDISDLSDGAYIARIKDVAGKVYYSKLIIRN
jgi:hypothetical protein